MKDYTIPTQGICPRSISFSIEDGKVYNIKVQGGCPGNTKAIAKLLEGADAQYIVDMLKGNDCGGKGTSCADQLARGVEKALAEQPA